MITPHSNHKIEDHWPIIIELFLPRLPREPFYEFLVTSLERPYEEGFEFLSDTPLQILTNNTDFFCCSLDWLFVEGRRRGAEFQAQVNWRRGGLFQETVAEAFV